MEQRRQRHPARLRPRWTPARGVILLTDMFGGTPSNLAISVMEQTQAEVIAGPEPADADQAGQRAHPPEPARTRVACAQEAGRKYISVASYVLAGEK